MDWYGWVMLALLVVSCGLTVWLWLRVERMTDPGRVSDALATVRAMEEARAEAMARDALSAQGLDELDAQIDEQRRRVLEASGVGSSAMSATEVRDAFHRLGFGGAIVRRRVDRSRR